MRTRPAFREKLEEGKALVGLMQVYPHPTMAEMAGTFGYDFIVLDCEHGLFGDAEILDSLRAASSTTVSCFVRTRGQDLQAIGRFMDMGVDGILVPGIETAEQAKTVVKGMSYPPAGTRGFAASSHRATWFGQTLKEHINAPRENVFFIALIETPLGIANIEDILMTDGVDAAIIGPSDLTANLGAPADFQNPAYIDALRVLELAADRAKKTVGAAPHPGQDIGSLYTRGYRFFVLGSDVGLIREAMVSQLAKARSSIQEQSVEFRNGDTA